MYVGMYVSVKHLVIPASFFKSRNMTEEEILNFLNSTNYFTDERSFLFKLSTGNNAIKLN
jgi:hypothetical protein